MTAPKLLVIDERSLGRFPLFVQEDCDVLRMIAGSPGHPGDLPRDGSDAPAGVIEFDGFRSCERRSYAR